MGNCALLPTKSALLHCKECFNHTIKHSLGNKELFSQIVPIHYHAKPIYIAIILCLLVHGYYEVVINLIQNSQAVKKGVAPKMTMVKKISLLFVFLYTYGQLWGYFNLCYFSLLQKKKKDIQSRLFYINYF